MNCEAPISPKDNFCPSCGQAKQVACPACGIGVEITATVCQDCGFNIKEGTSQSYKAEDSKMAKEVLALIHTPIGLGEFKKKYPYLNQGALDPVYVRVIESTMQKSKSKQIVQILASFPRQWAILKVGLLRRFLTLFIDWPLLLALFLGGLVFLIGSATEPGLLALKGGSKAIVAWGWFFVSYYLYFVATEFLLGATIGGIICGVRVVDKFGNKQSLSALLWRNTYKLVPLIGPYALGPYVKPDHEIVKS